jgi:tight adherence protein B
MADPAPSGAGVSPLGGSRAGAVACALVVAAGGAAIGGLPLAVAGACSSGVLVWLRRRRAAEASARRAAADWAELLDGFADALSAGLAPPLALRASLPAGPSALDPVPDLLRAAISAGGSPGQLLRTAGPVGRRLGACWELGAELGSPLSHAVAALRAGVEDSIAAGEELDSAVAGARASARVLALLAPAGLLLGTVAGLSPVRVLLHGGLGGGCLVAGVLLDLAGLVAGERLVDRARGRGRG